MSSKEHLIYLSTTSNSQKLYVGILQNKTEWDFTTNIGWAESCSLSSAIAIRDRARAELGLELKIEEVNDEGDE